MLRLRFVIFLPCLILVFDGKDVASPCENGDFSFLNVYVLCRLILAEASLGEIDCLSSYGKNEDFYL